MDPLSPLRRTYSSPAAGAMPHPAGLSGTERSGEGAVVCALLLPGAGRGGDRRALDRADGRQRVVVLADLRGFDLGRQREDHGRSFPPCSGPRYGAGHRTARSACLTLDLRRCDPAGSTSPMTTDEPDPAGPLPTPADALAPPPPQLPEVEQESTEDIIAGAPSTEEIIEHAEPAEDVLAAQPSVDELLGRDRDESPGAPGDEAT